MTKENLLNQTSEMLKVIRENSHNLEEIKTQFAGKKFKQDAIAMVAQDLHKQKSIVAPEVLQHLEDMHIDRIVGQIKDRPLQEIEVAGWEKGKSPSRLVNKKPQENAPESDKHKNTWIEKSLNDENPDPSEQLCEFITSNMMKFLRYDNSPRFRLYQETGASKFIENFKDINHMNIEERDKLIKEGKGFASFLANSILCGNYDLHSGNAGSRIDENGDIHWAGIDHGRGLSFNFLMDFNKKTLVSSSTPQSLTGFIEGMDTSIYPEELFHGVIFACDLAHEANNFNEKNMRKVIHDSLEVAKNSQINSLDNVDLENNLREKLGMPRSTEFNAATIEDAIIEHSLRLKGEMQEYAQQELVKAIGNQDLVTMLNDLEPKPGSLELFRAYAEYKQDEEALELLTSLGTTKTSMQWKEDNNTQENNLDEQDPETGRTAISIAAEQGDLVELKKLINQNVNLEITDYMEDLTPLHYAARNGQAEAAKLLIMAGANPDAVNADYQTALECASDDETKAAIEQAISQKEADKLIPSLRAAANSPNTVTYRPGSPQDSIER